MQPQLFQPLIENASDVITILTSDGIIRYQNPTIEQMLGYEPQELLGQSLLEFTHPDDVSGVANALSDGSSVRDCTSSFEFRFQHKDGPWCDLGAIAKNLLDHPDVAGIVLSCRDITQRKQAEQELRRNLKNLQSLLGGTINALVTIAENRDPYMVGHHQRVTQLACTMAEEMALPKEQIEGIRVAATIHDIGKITLPMAILGKLSRLRKCELGLVQTHPQTAYDLLRTTDFPWPVAQILLQHHERLDGSGYPRGLAGRNILLEARVLAIADVVEAMCHRRVYRSAFDVDKALEEILHNKGVLYDPQAADACLTLFTEKGFEFDNGDHRLED